MGTNRTRSGSFSAFLILMGVLVFIFTLLARTCNAQVSVRKDTVRSSLVVTSCKHCLLKSMEGYIVIDVLSSPLYSREVTTGKPQAYLNTDRKRIKPPAKVWLHETKLNHRYMIIPKLPYDEPYSTPEKGRKSTDSV